MSKSMTQRSKIRPVLEWFATPESLIHHYHQKTKILDQLNHLWKQEIDTSLANHTLIANLTEDSLVIAVDNANWASRLRYLIPQLLPLLKTWPSLGNLKDITWYISAPQETSSLFKTHSYSKMVLSAENQLLIQSVAKTISHPSLKVALSQLAHGYSTNH